MGTQKGHGRAEPRPTAQDDLVMATNNSSIVSKRSVERHYYPNEPHFFRFFVKKYQRRAPLINRGYHLRLHVIDVCLRNFLNQHSPKRKVIVNLGCGSDVIPWQCWTRYPEKCNQSRAVFVDVDFPDLVRRKRQVVLGTPELMSQLSGVETHDGDSVSSHILLRSDSYCQVGCDLRHTTSLEQALASIADLKDCLFLFVAEVSVTYMETDAADSLIQWASTLGQAEFCLLEQILPDGPDHPFARTMMSHFEKLSTPIKSVTTYPTIQSQCSRFRSHGWTTIRAQSLWSAWGDSYFLSPEERRRLDEVEAFDEWEEFALFASHYLLLHAKNYGEAGSPLLSDDALPEITCREVSTAYRPLTGQHGLRRFGAAVSVSDALGRESILNCTGLGNATRLPSYDIYTPEGSCWNINIQPEGPSSRMCHTLTDIGDCGVLMVGGRLSPSRAMADCWLFKRDSHRWERTWNLPVPLYRHSICRLARSSLTLVVGGRSGATGVSDLIMVYHPEKGWLRCDVRGPLQPKPVFGAILTCSGRESENSPVFSGFLIAGMSDDGLVQSQTLGWGLVVDDSQAPVITFSPANITGKETSTVLSRFGSACVEAGGSVIILGGVCRNGVISRRSDIAVCSTRGSEIQLLECIVIPTSGEEPGTPRPLMVGSSVVSTHNEIVIIGGGATCFSMGTFWTRGTYTLMLSAIGSNKSHAITSPRPRGWVFSRSGDIVQKHLEEAYHAPDESSKQLPVAKPIARLRVDSRKSFEDVLREGLPVILEGLDLGSCCSKWTLAYVTEKIREDRKVVVHESKVQNMDFNTKNFRYTTMTFGTFANEVKKGARCYLRALSADAPADQPTRLEQDFPTLASDFSLPDELRTCEDNIHSSVLRISGPVNMWLHYDVMANVYCQIGGSRRMMLFPPSDVTRLSFAPGASSSSIDVFNSLDSATMAGTHPWEANLSPGDVLFLPPLWLHTATPSSDVSLAVNVFFRNLDSGYSAGRDTYANRDLAAYEKGRQEITRIASAFSKTPADARQFYMLRLAEELAGRAARGEDC